MAVAHVFLLQNLWLENTSNEQILGGCRWIKPGKNQCSEKQSHSGSCWEKFKTTRKTYIYIYLPLPLCNFLISIQGESMNKPLIHFHKTYYRTVNIIWEQHHADFNTPNLPKILPQSWRIALIILVVDLQLNACPFSKKAIQLH